MRTEILELSVNRIEKYFCARERTDTLIPYHEGSAIVSCRQKFKKKKCFMYFILFLTKVIKMFATSYIPLCFKNPDYLGELK